MRVGKDIGLRLILNKQVIISGNVPCSDLESLFFAPPMKLSIILL